jgi:excinuclease ABC subunit A
VIKDGTIVAEGTPEDVARNDDSYTGQYLRDLLPKVDLEGPRADRDVAQPAADDD